MTIYNIGTGIAEVTDPAIGLYMAGMADPRQITEGVESSLYARAFIVVDRESGKRVVIVSADIWTCTQVVKTQVINRLKQSNVIKSGTLYNDDNVLISGTHTHSGPAGFSGNKLYDPTPSPLISPIIDTSRGFNYHTFVCIVEGMVTAIENAHKNLAPGKIYINTGKIGEIQHVRTFFGTLTIHKGFCGEQRSLDAFKNNKEYKDYQKKKEEKEEPEQTDREMLLLKFVALDQAGELPIGEINWYPIHPTDRGQFNHRITGDNKGYASQLFEIKMKTDYLAKDTFVAAFANSSCGDVSGNVGNGVPNEETAKNGTDYAHMVKHGKIQYDKAKELFDSATEELSGSVDYRHTRIDMANINLGKIKRTWPAAVGLSFAAGSSEDSVPEPNPNAFEGITKNTRAWLDLPWHLSDPALLTIGGLAATFGTTENDDEFIEGHGLKPIVFAPGLLKPPVVPNILPLQILKIGNLVITGVPGELTTMAGRRLKKTVLDELAGIGVDYLALATYANDYSQYITTREEYNKQHYEGASTLFGPYTLEAYQQEFKKLAIALRVNQPVSAGQAPQRPSSNYNRRITIRNLSKFERLFKFYKGDDWSMIAPFSTITLASNKEAAIFVPNDASDSKVWIDKVKLLKNVTAGKLIIIKDYDKVTLSDYTPPEQRQSHKSTIGRKGAIMIDDRLSPIAIPQVIYTNPSQSLQPILQMMHSDQPESTEAILHVINTSPPQSLQPILHVMNS